MPNRPLRACLTPGCSERVAGGHCDEHQRVRRHEHARYSRLYSTARWKRERKAYLRRHPLCLSCFKARRIVAASAVDHIRPHRGDAHWFWLQSNWQSICASCHGSKTLTEVQGASHRWAGSTDQRGPVELLRVHNPNQVNE